MNIIEMGDCRQVLPGIGDATVDLIYIDPPFNTKKPRMYRRVKTERDDAGKRTGFAGFRYNESPISFMVFDDVWERYHELMEGLFQEAHRALQPGGSFFLHIDYHEAHYLKVLLDQVFGRNCFMNEIIWSYDYGGRSKKKWPAKHDTIFWYTKDPKNYTFHYDQIDRIPYMAPGLVTPEKAARGKVPTDVWFQTIVPTNGSERTGYPTQKPLKILERIVRVHSNPGDLVLDFFAGSGTTGEAAAQLGRRFHLIDKNSEAITVMEKRLAFAKPFIKRA